MSQKGFACLSWAIVETMALLVSRIPLRSQGSVIPALGGFGIVGACLAAYVAASGGLEGHGIESNPLSGVTFETTDQAAGSKTALIVTSVKTRSPASDAGIVSGDVIAAVNGSIVHSSEDVRRALNQKKNSAVALRILHGSSVLEKTLPLALEHDN